MITPEFYNSLDISWRCRTKSSTSPRDPRSVFWLLRTSGSLCDDDDNDDDDDDDDDEDNDNYNSDNYDNYSKFDSQLYLECNSIPVQLFRVYLIDEVSRFTW